jgi:HIV Tat-specific factor 1
LAVKDECETKLGKVKKITVHEFNPEGVVQIKFEEAKAAEECIKLMNGRFFGGRELECFYWDGKTNYRMTRETLEQQNKRIDNFGEWLETNIDKQLADYSDGEEEDRLSDDDLNDGEKTPEHYD